MGAMKDGIHEGPFTNAHYCEDHCPNRSESEALIGCIPEDCSIEQKYDEDENE